MNVLVDTSIWLLALRRQARHLSAVETTLVRELRELIREGRAHLFGVVRQELLSGIGNAEQFEKLRTVLRAFPEFPVTTADYESAAEASNACRAKGIAVSVVDVVICAIAINRDEAIFTTDPDFQHYARVLPLKFYTPRK